MSLEGRSKRLCLLRLRLLVLSALPGIKAAATYLQRAAKKLHRILLLMGLNEGIELLYVSRPKMSKAFFKISRSCSALRS